jgi:broad specificity phosphatase PhoE
MPEGRRAAFDAGRRLAQHTLDDYSIPKRELFHPASILYSPSTRTRETAVELARGLESSLQSQNAPPIASPRPEPAIRNFQFLIDGQPFPPTDGMHPSLPVSAEHQLYFRSFWAAKEDPIAYWLNHPSEHAETPTAVSTRLRAFFISLLDAKSEGWYVLVTHSGPMRAFLREALGIDPGEPDFCEAFQVDASGVYYREQSAMGFRVRNS